MAKSTTNSQTIGELIGTVSGLKMSFESMQRNQDKNRDEFMAVFKGIRDDNKELANFIQDHIKDDDAIKSIVTNLTDWKASIESQHTQLWDNKNIHGGMWGASKTIVTGGAGFAMAILTVVMDRMWR